MYKENPTEDNRKVLMEHSEKLKKINAAFNFSELDDKGAQNK
jgi:hypothetical protein